MVSEDIDHDALERRGSVAVSLLHDDADHGSVYCGKRCFPYVLGNHSYLLVRVGQVNLGPKGCSRHVHSDLILIR